jgi:hypothetical protein
MVKSGVRCRFGWRLRIAEDSNSTRQIKPPARCRKTDLCGRDTCYPYSTHPIVWRLVKRSLPAAAEQHF